MFFLVLSSLGFLNAIWIYLGELNINDETWLKIDNWNSNHSFKSVMELFLIGIHFVVTTIATVGFGDILPVHIEEYIIVMIFQVYVF